MEQQVNSSAESDTVLYIKFFARCLIALGVPSFLWAVYISLFYSLDLLSAFVRLGATFLMVAVGLVLLALLPSKIHAKDISKTPLSDLFGIGGRIDGLMLFGSIPVMLGLLVFLPLHIIGYRNFASGDSKFDSVKVRIDSMEIRNVPEESVVEERILKVFYLPEYYIDLWLACGSVTILEVNGSTVEPRASRATFSYPKVFRAGGKNSRTYINHNKMNSEMESELYHVGETHFGWILREDPDAGVIFTRPSDKALREILVLTVLLLSGVIYFWARISIGRKIQDPHWISLHEICTNKPASAQLDAPSDATAVRKTD